MLSADGLVIWHDCALAGPRPLEKEEKKVKCDLGFGLRLGSGHWPSFVRPSGRWASVQSCQVLFGLLNNCLNLIYNMNTLLVLYQTFIVYLKRNNLDRI